ncbi:MAG: hypothetical protein ACI9LO_001037 [Planctomycetota bacterium]|jgi:hypothetical protein
MENDNSNPDAVNSWQEKVISLFDQFSNFAFYTMAVFIILMPPLKWVSELFSFSDNGWWVLLSVLVFAIVIPLLTELVANVSILSLEKIRNGEYFPVLFKPLKAIFAVVSIYGVLALEYKVIHGQSNRTLIGVYLELFGSL